MLRQTMGMMAAFVLALGVGVSTARAQTTIYVDDDAAPGGDGLSWATAYDSLSTALSAAEGGDQIWVAAGTYVGNFTLALEVELYGGFAGTETELPQRDWTANPTILDGSQSGSVVTSPPGATETTRIDGFTITNGSGTVLDPHSQTYGGGLYLRSSSPTIANNTIMGNSAVAGGGLDLVLSSPTIVNNTITGNSTGGGGGGLCLWLSSPTIANNTISGNSAGAGGGLYLLGSSPTIANNTISGNSADDSGGGLSMGSSSPTIANNTISGNSAVSGGGLNLNSSSPTIANNTITGNRARHGGGLNLRSSSPTIANNTITGNHAAHYGGGLYLYSSSPTIANNTIMGNSASREGGGLCLSGSSPTLANTIVAFNSSGIRLWYSAGTPTLRYNCVYGNTAYDYSGLDDSTGTNGNISANPLFVQDPDPGPDGIWGTGDDDFGDLHLVSASPCIDTGESASVPADTLDLDGDGDTEEPIPFDLDGHPRIVDGDDDGDPVVDMGAYESPVIATLDIMPGVCPNGLNPVWPEEPLRIAIAGSDSLDVKQIDQHSLLLARTDRVGEVISLAAQEGEIYPPMIADIIGPGEPCVCPPSHPDGLADMELRLSAAEVADQLELGSLPAGSDVRLILIGWLPDGRRFEGVDCIRIEPMGPGVRQLALTGG